MHTDPTLPPSLIDALRAARSVTVLTGDGISAESGLPTFRDPTDGIWARFRPQDLATTAAFRANPALVWGNLDVAVRAADAQRLRVTSPLYLLHGRAGELLPALVRAAWPGAEV